MTDAADLGYSGTVGGEEALGSVLSKSLGGRRGGLWAESFLEEGRELCAEVSQFFSTKERKDRIDLGLTVRKRPRTGPGRQDSYPMLTRD